MWKVTNYKGEEVTWCSETTINKIKQHCQAVIDKYDKEYGNKLNTNSVQQALLCGMANMADDILQILEGKEEDERDNKNHDTNNNNNDVDVD